MPPVVVLDACVLYPAAQRDLFMWLAAGGAIHAHWTNEIHDEWMRNCYECLSAARAPGWQSNGRELLMGFWFSFTSSEFSTRYNKTSNK